MRTFLIVEDNEAIARGLARFFRQYGGAVVSPTLAEAREALSSRTVLGGLVLDLTLPDGCGFELLEETAQRDPRIPTMVLSGNWSPEAMRKAQSLGAFFVPKPASVGNLEAFVEWAEGPDAARTGLFREVASLSRRIHLSPRETELLLHAAQGTPRAQLAERMSVAPSTIKTLVKRILKKSGRSSFFDVVGELHSRVFSGSPPPAP